LAFAQQPKPQQQQQQQRDKLLKDKMAGVSVRVVLGYIRPFYILLQQRRRRVSKL
jgi:hypothetical protein